MRAIKFRGFNNSNSEWNYGNLVIVGDEVSDYTLVDKNSVGQFTGLYDINGKEIYENDIVYYDELYYKEYLIKFYNSKFIVTPLKPDEPLKDPYEDSYSLSTFTHHSKTTETNLKLIGNIHENK